MLKGVKIDARMLSFSLLCSLCAALILAIVTTVLPIATPYFHYIAVIVFGFYYFIFYTIFAVPIRLVLNQRPKRYHIGYLLIYVVGAFIGTTFAIMVLVRTSPFFTPNFYMIVIMAGVIFWMMDSIFPQKHSFSG